MLSSSEILNSAADLLERGEWLQDYLARDAHGGVIPPEDPLACAFCLLGAIWHFSLDPVTQQRNLNTQAAKDAVSRLLGFESDDNGRIAGYNDHPDRTKEQVIATLREAAQQEISAGR